MMGREEPKINKLFYYGINLSKRIPEKHPLRLVNKKIDFNFVYEEVKDNYGKNGNVSVAPPKILKMLFLLYYYNVKSERELMRTIPYRIDWLWFLGYDLDSEIPDHSVLSKARMRWGEKIFKEFFKRILNLCIESGLVEGEKVFLDSTLVQANASRDSIIDRKKYIESQYKELEEKLEEDLRENRSNYVSNSAPAAGVVKNREKYIESQYKELKKKSEENLRENKSNYISKTDPAAGVVKKGKSSSRAYYKEHRSVDGKCGVITASKITTGTIDDGSMFKPLLEMHKQGVGKAPDSVCGDSKYGIAENYLECKGQKIKAHFKDLKSTHKLRKNQKGLFSSEEFVYDKEKDVLICPSGKLLKKSHYNKRNKCWSYKSNKKDCLNCKLRKRCTKSKSGQRSVIRHERQEEIEEMRKKTLTCESKRDLKKRKWLMEKSFADGENMHRLKKARWRGIERVQIQGLMIAGIQNIRILINNVNLEVNTAIMAKKEFNIKEYMFEKEAISYVGMFVYPNIPTYQEEYVKEYFLFFIFISKLLSNFCRIRQLQK
jgi:transposase